MIRNNQNRRRRGGNNNGPRPQQMNGGNNYGNRLDNRQRGNASQLLEKYRALARDAQQAGDRVTAEYYLQYADHYYRVLGDYRDKQPEQNRQRGRELYDDDSSGDQIGDDGDGGDDDEGDEGRDDSRRDDSRRDDSRRDDVRADRSNDARDDNRGNWRDDRPGPRDRNPRERDDRSRDDRSREAAPRSESPREAAPRSESPREPAREPRRDTDRDRQPWAGNGARDANRDSGRDNSRNRAAERIERPERVERRPDAPRERFDPLVEEGPIPGLPGPARLRMNRTAAHAEVEKLSPAALEPVLVTPPVPPVVADGSEPPAPRRRGRPRKVAVEVAGEG